jgi:hypothetical protein
MVRPTHSLLRANPGVQISHPKITVKTIARGMPGVSGVTVVTNARVYYTTRGCGRIGRPAFPAPSFFWGEKLYKTRAHRAAGGRGCVLLGCLTIESVQLNTSPPLGGRRPRKRVRLSPHGEEALLRRLEP